MTANCVLDNLVDKSWISDREMHLFSCELLVLDSHAILAADFANLLKELVLGFLRGINLIGLFWFSRDDLLGFLRHVDWLLLHEVSPLCTKAHGEPTLFGLLLVGLLLVVVVGWLVLLLVKSVKQLALLSSCVLRGAVVGGIGIITLRGGIGLRVALSWDD
jgi:hypothetical protein